MMRRNGLLCVLALAAALMSTGCPPTDLGNGSDTRATRKLDTSISEQPMPLPAPAPSSLRGRVEAAIDNVRQRDLLTSNSFWTVFHGILGLGPSILLTDDTGKQVNAVDYIC